MSNIYDHIELLGPRVLVRPLPELEFMADGLLVKPDSTRHTQNRAVVERVGDVSKLRGLSGVDYAVAIVGEIAVGDLVFYQKFAGTFVTLGDKERLMLNGDEVQGRVALAHVQLVAHTVEAATDIERRVRALDPEKHVTFSATEHLEGEPCLMCREMATLETREIAASNAKMNLEAMRERMRQARSSTDSSSDSPSAGSLDAVDSSSR